MNKLNCILSILTAVSFFASCNELDNLVEKQILTGEYAIDYECTISIPSDYTINEWGGEDFVVYYITPVDTAQSTFTGGIYFGNYPTPFEYDKDDSCKKTTREDKIAGENITWTIYHCGAKYSIQALVKSKSKESWCKNIHLFGTATSKSELEKLFLVFKTFTVSPKTEIRDVLEKVKDVDTQEMEKNNSMDITAMLSRGVFQEITDILSYEAFQEIKQFILDKRQTATYGSRYSDSPYYRFEVGVSLCLNPIRQFSTDKHMEIFIPGAFQNDNSIFEYDTGIVEDASTKKIYISPYNRKSLDLRKDGIEKCFVDIIKEIRQKNHKIFVPQNDDILSYENCRIIKQFILDKGYYRSFSYLGSMRYPYYKFEGNVELTLNPRMPSPNEEDSDNPDVFDFIMINIRNKNEDDYPSFRIEIEEDVAAKKVVYADSYDSTEEAMRLKKNEIEEVFVHILKEIRREFK